MLRYMTKHSKTHLLLCVGTSCDQPYVPVNGEFICSEEEEGVNCTLHCKEGYSFTQDAVHSYFCAFNGVWEPPYTPDRPDCSGEGNAGYSVTCCVCNKVRLITIHVLTHISNELLNQFVGFLITQVWPVFKDSTYKHTCAALCLFPVNRVANNGLKPFEMLFKASRCDDVDLVKSFTGEFNTKLGGVVSSCTRYESISKESQCSSLAVNKLIFLLLLLRSSLTSVAVMM